MAAAILTKALSRAAPLARVSSFPTTYFRRKMSKKTDGKTTMEKLIEQEGIVLMPGVQDALSAAIVQQSGFSAGFVSGYALSASLLGKPDFGLLTTTEAIDVTRNICTAVPNLPIITDADTGGDNALNVHRSVKDLIEAGAAGCFLEDQVSPKRCGHMQGKKVVAPEEHALKIEAAREAIGDADFFLVARTDARATSGLQEAISRANLYWEAGADGLVVEAPCNDDELIQIGRKVKGYKIANMVEGGKTPLHTPEELKRMGFHLIVHPLTSIYASARAMVDILKILKAKGTTRDDLEKIASFGEFNKLLKLESLYELESKFKNISMKH